jgi:formate dehydrogenase subunit delta
MTAIRAEAMNKLIQMANQIAGGFRAQPHEQAVAGVADHIRSFWTPKMRRDIAAHLTEGGFGLDPLARAAVEKLTAK